jgi:hypothetical protein
MIIVILFGWRPVLAQNESCIAQVFYGPGGKDEGNCSDPTTALCASHEYALEQGKQQCSLEVQVFSGNELHEVYRSPATIQRRPVDWVVALLYWSLPFIIGLPAGWLAGNWINRRRIVA